MTRDRLQERRLKERGGRDMCINCRVYRTGRADGICFRCNDQLETDKLVGKFMVPNPVPFPVEYRDAVLPCQETWSSIFLQDEASQEARERCWRCPVKDWCLDFGMYNNQWGIWGGLTQRERWIIRDGLSRDRCSLVA